MNESLDRELRARFTELRETDARGAPDFADVLERATLRGPRLDRAAWRPSRITISIAAAAAILLAVGIARVTRRPEFVATPLSTWTSPTASLLRTPSVDLITSPTLLSSILDPASSTAVSRRGKHK